MRIASLPTNISRAALLESKISETEMTDFTAHTKQQRGCIQAGSLRSPTRTIIAMNTSTIAKSVALRLHEKEREQLVPGRGERLEPVGSTLLVTMGTC